MKATIHVSLLCLVSLLSLDGSAATKLLVTGDSITRMTGGNCAGLNYTQCNSLGLVPFEASYSSLLPGLSNFDYVVVYNSGRGGDTCRTNAAWTIGAFAGLPRGLIDRVHSTVTDQAAATGATDVLVLIGINDVNGIPGTSEVPGVPAASITDTMNCIRNVWVSIRAQGYKVRALTYPRINPAANPWGQTGANNVTILNCRIRNEVYNFNQSVGNSNPVLLVDMESSWAADPSSYSKYLQADGLHPSPEGARKMALTWYSGSPQPTSAANCSANP